MKKENFVRVREICGGWGIYETSTAQKQMLYAISEAGELAKSLAKDDREQARDDIGDVLVCLINAYHIGKYGNELEDQADFEDLGIGSVSAFGELIEDFGYRIRTGSHVSAQSCDYLATIASNLMLSLDECLEQAISELEKRKGKMVNGVFVKESL